MIKCLTGGVMLQSDLLVSINMNNISSLCQGFRALSDGGELNNKRLTAPTYISTDIKKNQNQVAARQ
jgi:hypothetical protein